MSLSMYQASIPVVSRMLTNLSAILGKAAAHCESRKIDPAVLLTARLFPDMFPLVRQVQIATDHAKGLAARLAGIEVPSYADTEATFADLHARLAKTIAYVGGFSPEQINGSEGKAICLKTGHGELNFTGQDYLVHFALPNFYFHVTTAYAILRHNGVDVGKMDYLGAK
jgi:hypothetical protein